MIEELTYGILYEFSYLSIYVLVFCYFSVLYFVLGPIYLVVCKYLSKKNILHKIVEKESSQKQKRFELKHSLKSLFIFGFSSFPIIYMVREGVIELLPDTFINVVIGVILLTIWNEIHFFIVHRIMHLPFFLKHVHKIHHKSHIPTVFSIYSFHWFEALLLSAVPIVLAPIIPLSPIAIGLYPLASILLNYAGHCNYRFGNGKGAHWRLFGTFHNEHHYKFKENYGFSSHLLDKLYNLITKKNK